MVHAPLLKYFTVFCICLHFYLYQWTLYFFMLLRCYLASVFSFQLWRLPLAFLISQVLWWWNSSGFVYLGKYFFLLHFWRTLLPDIIFLVSNFVLQNFEYIIPLPSGLQGFCWAICWWTYETSLLCGGSLFSSCFQNSLSLTFDDVIWMCFSVVFGLVLVWFVGLLESECPFPYTQLRTFQLLFL